jgi:hypothetical protein
MRAAEREGLIHRERRKHERRLSDDLFFLVERRNGDLWKYGSITLCVALWAILGVLLR